MRVFCDIRDRVLTCKTDAGAVQQKCPSGLVSSSCILTSDLPHTPKLTVKLFLETFSNLLALMKIEIYVIIDCF